MPVIRLESDSEGFMGAVLILPWQQRAEVEMLACSQYPRESCGLLLGRRQPPERHIVRKQHRARNLADDNGRYELDPADYISAEAAATSAGIAIVGIWHSHPDHPAHPSAADLEWAWPHWSYLIVSVTGGQVVGLRSWRLDDGHFAEEEIHDV